MQGPASFSTGSNAPARASLGQRQFPRRVRTLLEGVLDFVSDEVDRGIATMLGELEQQLFKLAEQARSNSMQKGFFDALREVKRGRADLAPRFLLGLETALAGIQDPPRPSPIAGGGRRAGELSLVEDVVMDESVALNEIATRCEIRNSLPLFLLGQRFGVIAGRPAFDSETLPIGPQSLVNILREAVGCLDLNSEYRQLLYRQFDRSVMQFLAPMYEAVNAYLIRERVLPNLTYVPLRAQTQRSAPPPPKEPRKEAAKAAERAADREKHGIAPPPGGTRAGAMPAPPQGASAHGGPTDGEGDPTAPSPGTRGSGHGQPPPARSAAAAAAYPEMPTPSPDGPRPFTAWPGTPDAAAETHARQDTEMFDVLRQLLAGRRALLGKLGTGSKAPSGPTQPVQAASADDVQKMLGVLQTRPVKPLIVDGKPQPRSITHLKQDLLAQLRSVTPEDKAPALEEEHSDTIDLVGMLFDHILKDVRPNTAAASLLGKLQVPLLRVALNDKAFFTRRQHPARQMLNTIAETGMYWSGEDEADRTLIDKMNLLVDRVTQEFSGDMTLFDSLLGDLGGHLQTQVRKAEVAERRHVEAARGKEKLELARMRAAEAVDAKLAGKRVPKFLHTLLGQAWTDVLSLSLLRGGEQSDGFQHQLQIAERLIESAVARRTTGTPLIAPSEAPALKAEIEEALTQVGYHGNDAKEVSARLLAASGDEDDDDPASRTELAMKLKSRVRLGQNIEGTPNAGTGAGGEKLPPLNDAERACFDQIRRLPFGTWFDFTVNQQGDITRRRMSWFSTVTGHCLFVNHRGQRAGEYTLSWLAREMCRGTVKIVQAEQGSVVDRAWQAIVGALRSFAGGTAKPAQAAT
ncbi:DUF1631 domain-containing protein [Chiayiivirga flava]|uniref:DUF1631 domain-containing protein n=1 Tax=Chiayiivirga flava TaxID=659595 RepID=A0A7W8G1H4_9GAMM|nr:DUF1631 domain-containing protein [Chiayiivirga flava]MBB5207635.1 hypothetical protein [Chiayiivirga flava]